MKKAAIVLLLMGFIVLMAGSVQAEPYKGATFPSDQQIFKSLSGFQGTVSVGKYKDSQDSYSYYFKNTNSVGFLTVKRLDTGVWIVGSGIVWYIVQQ